MAIKKEEIKEAKQLFESILKDLMSNRKNDDFYRAWFVWQNSGEKKKQWR